MIYFHDDEAHHGCDHEHDHFNDYGYHGKGHGYDHGLHDYANGFLKDCLYLSFQYDHDCDCANLHDDDLYNYYVGVVLPNYLSFQYSCLLYRFIVDFEAL